MADVQVKAQLLGIGLHQIGGGIKLPFGQRGGQIPAERIGHGAACCKEQGAGQLGIALIKHDQQIFPLAFLRFQRGKEGDDGKLVFFQQQPAQIPRAGRRTFRMDNLKILVVDDESRMRKLVKDFLQRQNYTVLEAADGEQAVDLFYEEKDIALLILDVMMPKMDGWEVCREIRQYSKVPIIMLTARGDERDELLGFQLGVDEYISKPFSPKILVARVEAILRRAGVTGQDETIEAGGIRIDKSAHQVLIDGKSVELSFKEFELLSYFVENMGIALSREKILNAVWNYDYYGDARTIDTHVKKLRSKMGEKGNLIRTIWGMGYKFDPDGESGK